jgi:putative FmdB family regulatory protein
MPLYEYECRQCKQLLEAIQKVSDEPYSICPHCGGEMRRLVSAPAIHFKGSGFYKTDYGSGSGSRSGKPAGESKAEATNESKTDSKGDAKPDSKSAGKDE